MSKIARYQGNVRAFASDSQGMERTVFGGTNQADDLTSQITASFLRGWGIVGASEHPSLEDFNAAMYAMSQFIAYQHQMGIAEWHAEQEYHLGSICTHNGESYQSLQNANVGSQPPSAKWTPVLTSKNGLANLGLHETGFATFTSSGRFIVPAGVTELWISAVAGGGGGGSGSGGDSSFFGGGGGSGGAGESIVKRKFTVVPGSVIDISIGAGGIGSIASTATGSAPTAGGDTVIGDLIRLHGGQPGVNAGNGQNTAPGGGYGQGFPTGSYGGDGNLSVGSGNGAPGASSPFGGGGGAGRAGTDQGTDGTAGSGYGSGGGSGGGKYGTAPITARGGNGGNGAPGIVIIEW